MEVFVEIYNENLCITERFKVPEEVADYIADLKDEALELDLENELLAMRVNQEIENANSIYLN